MTYNAPVDDIYDPSQPSYETGTPTLDDIIRSAMRNSAMLLRVMLPAQVINVKANQQVDVQPAIQVRYRTSNTPRNMPPILDVPVVMPIGQNYRIKVPVAKGDQGMLVFCDRSLDAWSGALSPGPVDPGDTRTHHISDPVFMPGMLPFAQQDDDDTTDLVVTAGQAELRVQQAGTFTLAAGGQELLSLTSQLAQAVSQLIGFLGGAQTLTLTTMGPQPFIALTQGLLQQQKAVVDQLAQNLESITGATP